jgi:hypothetical protein
MATNVAAEFPSMGIKAARSARRWPALPARSARASAFGPARPTGLSRSCRLLFVRDLFHAEAGFHPEVRPAIACRGNALVATARCPRR